jgi:hypothetical protein
MHLNPFKVRVGGNHKIVVIGGPSDHQRPSPSGQAGLPGLGAASPNTGVNTITGEGLKQAMADTQVVIDLANSPSFEDKAVLEFRLPANLRRGGRSGRPTPVAGHVGTDRSDNGYFRAKVVQENWDQGLRHYTIIRLTPVHGILRGIAGSEHGCKQGQISPGHPSPSRDDVAANAPPWRFHGAAMASSRRRRNERRSTNLLPATGWSATRGGCARP